MLLAVFTGMLAAKTSNRLLCKGMRPISAIRCLLRRYNNHKEVCSVTLLARHRYLDIKSHRPRDRKGVFDKRRSISMTDRMLSAALQLSMVAFKNGNFSACMKGYSDCHAS
jgi:hypothetical protein